ncbi:MAG: nicotinamide riboside transporter PnuC [Alphaproteobacteria bacterium]|nr:nicotinamide riboside transporter PnuC [Alphaproteobacteria bacterium]
MITLDKSLEVLAVCFGIIAVWLNKNESIWGFIVGILNTTMYMFICFKSGLIGESIVNTYYTITSIYGIYLWQKKTPHNNIKLQITKSTKKELYTQFLFFLTCFILLYLIISYFKKYFFANALPLFDSFCSATAFTGMWLLAKKKLENWLWWIVTNIFSIALFYIKGYQITTIQYLVFLIIAVKAYLNWQKLLKIQ